MPKSKVGSTGTTGGTSGFQQWWDSIFNPGPSDGTHPESEAVRDRAGPFAVPLGPRGEMTAAWSLDKNGNYTAMPGVEGAYTPARSSGDVKYPGNPEYDRTSDPGYQWVDPSTGEVSSLDTGPFLSPAEVHAIYGDSAIPFIQDYSDYYHNVVQPGTAAGYHWSELPNPYAGGTPEFGPGLPLPQMPTAYNPRAAGGSRVPTGSQDTSGTTSGTKQGRMTPWESVMRGAGLLPGGGGSGGGAADGGITAALSGLKDTIKALSDQNKTMQDTITAMQQDTGKNDATNAILMALMSNQNQNREQTPGYYYGYGG